MSKPQGQSLQLEKATTSNRNVQRFGAFLSLACAIHCLATPLLIALLPFAGAGFLEDPAFEIPMVGLGFAIGFITVLRSEHNRRLPITLLIFGSMLVIAAFTLAHESLEHILLPLGAGMAALAQIINLRYNRSCSNPHHNH